MASLWVPRATLLKEHASAEERLLSLQLFGPSASAADETKDAIADHNHIRDVVPTALRCDQGSGKWWRAVLEARELTSTDMSEEEPGALADFPVHVDDGKRRGLGGSLWLAYAVAHAANRDPENRDRDPDSYVQGAT